MKGKFAIALAGILAAAVLAAPAMAQTTGIALGDGRTYSFFGGDGMYQADGMTFIICDGKVIIREEGKPDRELPLCSAAGDEAVLAEDAPAADDSQSADSAAVFVETQDGVNFRVGSFEDAEIVEERAAGIGTEGGAGIHVEASGTADWICVQTEDAGDVCLTYSGAELCPDIAGGMNPEVFEKYEAFGLRCDAAADALYYQGQRVRVFEDSYPVGDQGRATVEHLDDAGTVDVRALRDLTKKVCNADGSENPGGVLLGLEALSAETFAARDFAVMIHPIQEISVTAVEGSGAVNWYVADVCGAASAGAADADEPSSASGDGATAKREATAWEGGELSAEEMRKMYAPYEEFGLTYDAEADALYYQGRRVRYFLDVQQSNGETLDSGKFHGCMRQFSGEDGEVDVHAIRDFDQPDADGNGKLTGMRAEEVR